MKTVKTTRRKGVGDASAQRLNARLDAEAYQRLQIHCVMSGMTPGALLSQLITTHCRDWKVQPNTRSGQSRPILDADMIGETASI